MTKESFVSNLLREVPEFEETYRTLIIEDRDLPYMIVSYLLAYVLALLREDMTQAGGPFTRALHFVESALKEGDLEVKDMLATNFVENISHAGRDYGRFKKYLGPLLLAELEHTDGKDL